MLTVRRVEDSGVRVRRLVGPHTSEFHTAWGWPKCRVGGGGSGQFRPGYHVEVGNRGQNGVGAVRLTSRGRKTAAAVASQRRRGDDMSGTTAVAAAASGRRRVVTGDGGGSARSSVVRRSGVQTAARRGSVVSTRAAVGSTRAVYWTQVDRCHGWDETWCPASPLKQT